MLGIDVGTSSVKVVLIDDTQRVLASATSPLKLARPEEGWSEQNPEDWWKATLAAVGAVQKQKRRRASRRWKPSDFQGRCMAQR